MIPGDFERILQSVQAKKDKEGFFALPEGSSLTIYVAHGGASLSVTRVEAVRIDEGLVVARTQKRESFTVIRDDIFAVMTEGGGGQPQRRAGFG